MLQSIVDSNLQASFAVETDYEFFKNTMGGSRTRALDCEWAAPGGGMCCACIRPARVPRSLATLPAMPGWPLPLPFCRHRRFVWM